MNKKILFLLSAAAMTASSISASPLTPDQALARAGKSGMMKAVSTAGNALNPMPVYSAGNETPLYYVFENKQSGFVIISADDVAVPVLGYADSGRWDANAMPPDMKWWLEQYGLEIEAASASAAPAAPAAVSRDYIAPIVKTLWNQAAPYNDMCPAVRSTKTYTGCVATAMAQVMKVHDWPATGKGSQSYTWNNKNISLDFSTVTFNWDNMLDYYTGRATDAQKNAVAQLMYACGVSVKMSFGTDESGALVTDIAPALVNNFDYDPSIAMAAREFYGITEWEDLVYGELSAGRPVIYSGSGADGGHCFVCDGYNDGFFHFNWGWGGVSDGFFRLSALNPNIQGIGGNASGFNDGQIVIYNIKKPVEGSVESTPVFGSTTMAGATVSGNSLTMSGIFCNYSTRDITGRFRLKAVSGQGGDGVLLSAFGSNMSLEPGSGFKTISGSISRLSEGTYRVYPVFVDEAGTEYPVLMPTTQLGYAILEKGLVSTVQVPASGEFTVNDVSLGSELYWGSDFSISGTIVNTGENDIVLPLYPVLLSSAGYNGILAMGSAINTEVPAGGSVPVEYIGNWERSVSSTKPADARYIGFVTLGPLVLSSAQYQQSYVGISVPLSVDLKDAVQTSVFLTDWTINNGDIDNVDRDKIPVSITLKCESGYFGGSLDVAIFPLAGGTSLYAFSSPVVFIPEGETKTIEFTGSFPTATPGRRYSAAVYYNQDRLSSGLLRFKIAALSGIAGVAADDAAVSLSPNPATTSATVSASSEISTVAISSLAGNPVPATVSIDGNNATIDVEALPSGIYIVTVSTENGTESQKLIKK